MKGINYVASVLRVYRQALDEYLADPSGWRCRPEWMEELAKMSHRGYTTGFLFGEPRAVGQEYQSAYIRSHEFVGAVQGHLPDGRAVVAARNRIAAGDRLEVIGPSMRSDVFTVDDLTLLSPEEERVAVVHPNQTFATGLPFEVEPFDLIRRQKVAA
jgi:putative protease